MCFKCDAPFGMEDVEGREGVEGVQDTHPGARFGCLGVLRRGGKPSEKTLEDVNDFYFLAMAVSVVTAIERLSTSLRTGVPDQTFVAMFCSRVRIRVADDGSSTQKALRFFSCWPCSQREDVRNVADLA